MENENSQETTITKDIDATMRWFHKNLAIGTNFDMLYREMLIGGRKSCVYFIDGFCKDELMQKLLQYFLSIKKEEFPENARDMCISFMPYVEVELQKDKEVILKNIFSGVLALFIDGFEECILIDSRTYPLRSVSEPEKDKTLRGSKDGFVETVIFNTALIRRRIRDRELRIEILSAGKASKTDIVLCYMQGRVNQLFLRDLKRRISQIKADALTMNQESLAECIFQKSWLNPFPKFKFTERPDTAAAQILEGNVVVLVDNSPFAMILPVSLLDIVEEADDYYFPPVTGTYLRLARLLISIASFLIPPTFLLLTSHTEWIPQSFAFIEMKEAANIPVFWQFLILELAIDGLRLAAVNTPNMLSTPLSIMAGLVLGEFSVQSGWFNAEVLLYEAFVAVAGYTQPSYELSYAIKFFRILTLVFTALFSIYGYIAGILLLLIAMAWNKTLSNKPYLYPLFPLNLKKLCRRLIRTRLKNN